jgi:hypothetical protein
MQQRNGRVHHFDAEAGAMLPFLKKGPIVESMCAELTLTKINRIREWFNTPFNLQMFPDTVTDAKLITIGRYWFFLLVDL